MSKITTSQTIGPFSHEAWQWAVDLSDRAEPAAHTVTIHGIIHDGDGVPIDDAQLEAWTPHAAGAEARQPMAGFRRIPSGAGGEFAFRLSLGEGESDGPAAFVTVFARGLVKHQFTAVFLEDGAPSPLLAQVPEERRATLLARREPDGSYRWDIHMQGPHETVFFDYV
ncbi:protocatechuate 3,4-dioxygenase alpha subunit [Pseudoduganella flava]|uniref:Protocatechuate 3,4-dioxygenase n=1 Tax=Pseudoduganella flava TaxID=871742 RepID=A0A562PKN2_9BURK|nr:protocatechuate 3,4-dioxygenase [Pseudoduganella flava]QGZ42452.1 protocatechuate 3,4-dioxygenase [Pseudoduganella flava]TWI45022.1 protocatechuate 3,4-dioxygenase alpha subunit [Pseudoduganella flava]